MGRHAPTLEGRTTQIPPGTRLGRYRIVRRIASGGMAEVYLARAEGPGGFAKPVALKLVLPHLAEQAEFRKLFGHEARVAALLNHPNIVQIFEFGDVQGDLFIAMEYVDGVTLQELLARCEFAVSPAPALAILTSCCTALHHAHEVKDESGRPLSLVHRDISPSNVMIRRDGQIKVVDFGIAKAVAGTEQTRTGSLKGKAGYMSPEQCRGESLTRRSDIFNLGILLYEITTRRRAFRGANIFEAMNRIVDGKYPRPSVVVPGYPAGLEQIIARALALEPCDRYTTALEMRTDVESFASEQGLALSELPVADLVHDLFGPPTEVNFDVETDPSVRAGGTGPAVPMWARAAMIGGLAGTVVYVVLGSAAPTAAPAQTPSAPPPVQAAAEPTTAASAALDRASPAPAGAHEIAASPDQDLRPPEPAAAAVPDESVAKPSSTATRRRSGAKRRKKRRPRPSKAAKKNSDPLLPWRPNP